MCSSFLWKGTVEGRHSAKVAWGTITKPKEEGGLGVRNLSIWNKACMLRLVWMLFNQAGSIWVAWYREEILGGSLSNFWSIRKRNNYSWMANKILKSKEYVYNWIKLRVGNGVSCRFWWDNWSPFGKLIDYLDEGNRTRLGIPLTTVLHDIYNDGVWTLPPARTDKQVLLQAYLTTLSLTDEDDCYDYSWHLWQPVALRCSFTPSQQWNQTISDLQAIPAASTTSQLILLAWQSTMYYIWTERNSRLHNLICRSSDFLFLQIDSSIRNRISSRRSDNPRNSSRMMQQWFSTDL
ncbi:hypothetical protein N665_1505s0013 [Sinapis alba]|nr:hypothetical protein N665_1505s0013 [Sinapis alba]